MDSAGHPQFMRAGEVISRSEALAAPVLIVEGGRSPLVGRVLESHDHLVPWLREKPGTERMVTALEKARAVNAADSIEDEEWVIQRQQTAMKRTIDDLEALAAHTGLDMASEQFHTRATQPENPLEPPAFDPLSLCSIPGGWCSAPGADWLPMGGGLWHDLRRVWPFGDWNDRAISYRVSGFATVFEDIHFGGASLFLTGHPVLAGNLDDWGWANRISSAIVA